jgi:hypothetical protein
MLTEEIPFQLVKEIQRGDCVLFVGAGLSMGAGLPGWGDLLAPLSTRIRCASDFDPLKIAQVYEVRESRRELLDHILERTDTTGARPTNNHLILGRLGFKIWVTTNYDNLIERTLEEIKQPFVKIVRDKQISLIRGDRTVVVKFHGDRDDPETIIITKKDFLIHSHKSPILASYIYHQLARMTFLFIGYSMNDPDFDKLHADIALHLQEFQRVAYCVLFDADQVTIDDLGSRNIRVINLSINNYKARSDCLQDFLINLQRQAILYNEVTTKIYHLPESQKLVPANIIEALNNQGYSVCRNIEYLTYNKITDESQYIFINPQVRLQQPEIDSLNEIIMEYIRTESSGDIWYGYAIGTRSK